MAFIIFLQLMKATVLTRSSVIFSPGSLCNADVYRHESSRCHTLPFFLTFHLSRFSFNINIHLPKSFLNLTNILSIWTIVSLNTITWTASRIYAKDTIGNSTWKKKLICRYHENRSKKAKHKQWRGLCKDYR